MIAVIFSEIAGWLKYGSRATISGMVILMGFAGSLTFLRPEYCLEILTAGILWVAIKAGKENWSEFWTRDWVKRTDLPLRTVILGKVLATLVVASIHLLFVLPILIIMLILWGFTWWQLSNVLLTMLISGLIAAEFGLCGSCLGKGEETFLIDIPVTVWMVATALNPSLRQLNPFYCVWNVLVSNVQWFTAAHFINLGIVALLVLTVEFLFQREAH